jgi:hypothetical protein
MAEIVLQFVEGSGFGSGLIKYYGHGDYSHVDAVLPDGTLLGARNDVIGGVPAGVQIRPADYVGNSRVFRVVLHVDEFTSAAFYEHMRAEIGKPYNKIAILAFAVNANWSSVGAWFCSQLVTAKLQACGWLKDLDETPNKIDPDDLRLILSALV